MRRRFFPSEDFGAIDFKIFRFLLFRFVCNDINHFQRSYGEKKWCLDNAPSAFSSKSFYPLKFEALGLNSS
jgi:hypothetical protein